MEVGVSFVGGTGAVALVPFDSALSHLRFDHRNVDTCTERVLIGAFFCHSKTKNKKKEEKETN